MSLRLVTLSPLHSIENVLNSVKQIKGFDAVVKVQSFDAFVAVSVDSRALHLSEVGCASSVLAWTCDDDGYAIFIQFMT